MHWIDDNEQFWSLVLTADLPVMCQHYATDKIGFLGLEHSRPRLSGA